jgi:hypothetical protein
MAVKLAASFHTSRWLAKEKGAIGALVLVETPAWAQGQAVRFRRAAVPTAASPANISA